MKRAGSNYFTFLMAERIDDISPLRGRPAIYPWSQWLDGSAWRIHRGTDYEVASTSMTAIIRQAAERAGLTVTCRRVGDEAIDFQVFSEEAAA